jgi:hypothetical protein
VVVSSLVLVRVPSSNSSNLNSKGVDHFLDLAPPLSNSNRNNRNHRVVVFSLDSAQVHNSSSFNSLNKLAVFSPRVTSSPGLARTHSNNNIYNSNIYNNSIYNNNYNIYNNNSNSSNNSNNSNNRSGQHLGQASNRRSHSSVRVWVSHKLLVQQYGRQDKG